MSRFIPDDLFICCSKQGVASGKTITRHNLTEKLGEPVECNIDGKVECEWRGEFITDDGETVKVVCWDWCGNLANVNEVCVWCEEKRYLFDWIEYLQTP
jgi:hypothetical protein